MKCVTLLLVLVGVAGSIPAQIESYSWPDYRGPQRNGTAAPGCKIPSTWSETENVRFKTKIPGRGWSSPVVQDGRAWLTTADPGGTKLSVIAVDLATGRIAFERVVFTVEKPAPRNALNSYASPSAVTEPGRVYAHFGTYGTAALASVDGAVLWQRRDLVCDHMEGPGSSPLLWEELLILNVDGGDVQYVVALDKATGATRWRTPRSEDLTGLTPEFRKSFSTPVPATVGGRPWILSTGAQATYAYDPADGRELWRQRHRGFSQSSRPLVVGEFAYLNTGFMAPRLLGVALGGSGVREESTAAFAIRTSMPTMPSPVSVEGRLYLVSDRGVLTCAQATTGEKLWSEKIGGEHCASPLAVGERLFFFDREGSTKVVAAGATYALLGENRLDEGFMASPAPLPDGLLLRTTTHLYRIGGSSR